MRLPVSLSLLWLGAGLAPADPAAELAVAGAALEKVRAGLSARVNRLDGELRAAIWTRDYYALDRLQRMELHRQMMPRHKQDRSAQFDKARAEFDRAFGELERLRPPTRDL